MIRCIKCNSPFILVGVKKIRGYYQEYEVIDDIRIPYMAEYTTNLLEYTCISCGEKWRDR